MALEKHIVLGNGVQCNYWVITTVFIAYGEDLVSFRYSGYIDRQARLENLHPVAHYTGECRYAEITSHWDQPINDIRYPIYRWLKENTQLHGAEDV